MIRVGSWVGSKVDLVLVLWQSQGFRMLTGEWGFPQLRQNRACLVHPAQWSDYPS